jgi:hypothetical protein
MPASRAPAPDQGFVLVGVVVFVLALTILVLSLYGLSSYEAQFLQRSIDAEQAFQSAVGGIERAKFALAQTSRLESVTGNLPEDVDSTVAVQDGREAGTVVWDGPNVTIRVTARVSGARRTIVGNFTPKDSVALSYYSSLITVSEGVEVVTESENHYADNRDHAVLLGSPIWASSASSGHVPNDWDHLIPPVPDIRTSPQVPVPDVAPFLTPGKIAAATLITATGAPAHPIILDASATPGVPAYFRADDTDPYFSFNSYPRTSCAIHVSGLAVWLLPRGAFFNQGTVITGDPSTACLVVIAKPGSDHTSSIFFNGYLQASIPVILVSSGEVLLWHENNYREDTITNDVAIFARSASLMGPDPDYGVLHLSRNPNGPLNTLFLEELARHGALPNASWGGRRLDLIPGTWQASDR